ncbi:MAG TPA: hypothetical protein VM299_05200 [Solirubrobacteraceae bacterium]|nr:hypothetical protein [Solirubrobacteraceae bacterium]
MVGDLARLRDALRGRRGSRRPRSAAGSPSGGGGGALRTTPRSGTAFVTASVGRASASLMSAISTGVIAAVASVPGRQICDVV